jgi:hypothetical protein
MVKRTHDNIDDDEEVNNKKQKTSSSNSPQVVSVTSLPTTVFLKAFSHMIGDDILSDEYAYHTWNTVLTTSFESWFNDEDIENEHVEEFVNLAMGQLEKKLSNGVTREILRPFIFDKLIPDLMEYIRGRKTEFIIPSSVQQLEYGQELTSRIRDLYVKQKDEFICFASKLYKEEGYIPVFYSIQANTTLNVDALNIQHPDISEDNFYDMSDGSCTALLNDNELLMLYNGELYSYNRSDVTVTKFAVDQKSPSPKFRTSDIVTRDSDNFVVLAATADSDDPNNPTQLWNFNISTKTWSILDNSVKLPVADAITIHKNELYVCVPSKDENKPAVFTRFNFETKEWTPITVTSFSPLVDRMRITSFGDSLAALCDIERQPLLFLFKDNEWKAVDLDAIQPPEDADNEMELFDTLIAKNPVDNTLILYYEYYSDETGKVQNKGYLQAVSF